MDLNKKLEELKPYQLNCNVFDVYSYNGLTMQDLLCQFFTKINECITVSNETIDLAKWLVNEGLEIEVVKKLMIWLEDGTLENIINVNIFNTLNEKINGLSSRLEHIAKYADIPMYNLGHITNDIGVTKGIQTVLDEISNTGVGRILLDRVYEIEKPLVIDRQNQNTNTSIEFYGGGCIKKSANFQGNQLILLKTGFHDEDNIIFNNISFDGVDRTVNGVDTFENLNYNKECSDKSQHNESKFVKFYNCSFNNCYHGARLSSLSWVFSGCLFEHNNYGVYLDCSANANTFLGCSIRRNIIGVKIKQFDATIGTISNGFYNCTIESNQNLGVISVQSQQTRIIGCYFENNGTSIDNNFEKQRDNKSCHILLNDSGGAGGHTIDSFFNVSDFNIDGLILNSTIIKGGKINLQLATDSNFINQSLNDITFIGFGEYTSSFILNGEKYKSTKDTKIIYKENEVPGNYIYKKHKDYTLIKTSNLSSNTCKLCDITINEISNGFIDFNAILLGRTASGNNISSGIITGKIGLMKATNNTNNYTACVSGLKFINCDGAPSGGSGNTQKLFGDGVNITVNNNLNVVTLTLNDIDLSSMINWGSITKIDINIVANFTGIANPKSTSFEVITLS